MANAEMMNKVMTEEELEQVVGGAKVFILTYLKNGKIDAFYGEFTGDAKALRALVNGGKVKSLKAHFSAGHMQGIRKDYLQGLLERYRKKGYRILETREK